MKHYLSLIDLGQAYATVEIPPPRETPNGFITALTYDEIPVPPGSNGSTRRRTRGGRRRIAEFFDPEREHPVLKKLIQSFAPIAISFLTQSLPEWLGDLQPSRPGDETP